MRQPIIRLYDLNGIGLIIEHPSGVLYTNQVGGVTCAQPTIEGVLVPLDDVEDLESKLEAYFSDRRYVTPEDADALDALLRGTEVPPRWTPTFFLEVDRTRLRDSMEAWLHVTVKACPDELLTSYQTHSDGTVTVHQTLSGRPWHPDDQPELGPHAMQYPIFGFGRRPAVLTWPNSD